MDTALPAPARKSRRKLVLSLIALAGVCAGVGGIAGYLALQSNSVQYAVGDCVKFDASSDISEQDCDDATNSQYRIVARGSVAVVPEAPCMKYQNATRTAVDPTDTKTVLCLAPTQYNSTDPGALHPHDCVEAKNEGETITRTSCLTFSNNTHRVVGTELRPRVPVTDQACRTHPTARGAYAQASLGGRAIVVCVVPVDPKEIGNVQVGDCTDATLARLVECKTPDAKLRALAVRTVYQRPARPECLGVPGATAVSVRSGNKTDLVFVSCWGPVPENRPIYAHAGDCLAFPASAPTALATRVDCSDPAADRNVLARVDSTNRDDCPGAATSGITWDDIPAGPLTICLSRR
ncbi:hypothetical protein [Nocardia sp. XZ_19_385]|uniref:LppU/SCO3897 family protein n=1 Tax=Nocardia sp. XZ_19_385 TaxID=2769488 RepID=UPI00188EE858|nr:hypothetical protein [Nocardia sp. XZ_19_385]